MPRLTRSFDVTVQVTIPLIQCTGCQAEALPLQAFDSPMTAARISELQAGGAIIPVAAGWFSASNGYSTDTVDYCLECAQLLISTVTP